MRRELVAKILANQQPPSTFRRLVADRAFLEPLGLSPRTSVTLGGAGSFEAVPLFKAVRAAVAEGTPQSIDDMDGVTVSVVVDHDELQLRREIDGPPHRIRHPVFLLAASAADRRRQAFEALRASLGPTAPQFDNLALKLNDRPLTERELAAVLQEIASGVANRQRQIVAAVTEQPRLALSDLVPDELGFFERCFGPDPKEASPDVYLTTILPEYRRGLLSRDLAGGLSLCLPAYLRDDLTLTTLVEDRADTVLWEALEGAAALSDPFSALGALDLAISRSGENERFRAFAEEAVERLVAERFDGPGGADLYALLPPLVLAVEDHLAQLEGAMLRPPFWRRLCAFAHANWLCRHLAVPEEESQRFCDWLQGQHTLPGRIRELVDLRAEPMWLTSHLSASSLRAEIVGRLALLVERHRRDGQDIPAVDKISAVIEGEDGGPRPLARYRPGPLEGHRRPAGLRGGLPLPTEVVSKLTERLTSDLSSPAWGAAVGLTDLSALPEEVLAAATRRVEPDLRAYALGAIPARRLGLLSAGLIAARHRHSGLSGAVAAHCLAEAAHGNDAESADTLFTALLVAAATWEDDCEWAEWLEPKLLALVDRVPASARNAIDWYGDAISVLKHMVGSAISVTWRAEAVLHMVR